MRSDVRELGEEVTEAGDLVSQAEAEVRNFAEAFTLSPDFGRGGCFHLCRWIKRCCGRRFDADTEEHRGTQ